MTRAPVSDIPRPSFPPRATWINDSVLRADRSLDRPVLVEFWDFCRPNSIRTLPYLRAWDARYRADDLRVIGVHSPGFAPSADPDAVRAAVARLAIEYPVLVDSDLQVWHEYDNLGWPARYLFGADGMLVEYHFGEGAYAETEAAIRVALGLEPADPVAPVRPADAPDAPLVVQSDDVAGPYCGPYEAGEVWAVLEPPAGRGATVRVNGETVPVDYPGAHRLIAHEASTTGELSLELGDGVVCHAVCFAPGLAG